MSERWKLYEARLQRRRGIENFVLMAIATLVLVTWGYVIGDLLGAWG